MISIIKDRARKWLVKGQITTPRIHPEGVGGVYGKPVYSFVVGEYTIFMPRYTFEKLMYEFRSTE